MVFELVKNSLRAVQERFMDSDKVAPPVRIIVADGLEDVTIKVLIVVLYRFMKSSVKFLGDDEGIFFHKPLIKTFFFFFSVPLFFSFVPFYPDNLTCHFQ
jgi:hypothetical protein